MTQHSNQPISDEAIRTFVAGTDSTARLAIHLYGADLTEDLWQLRIDGPVYRRTLVLGRFRWYRQFRVWMVRRGKQS
jgi:hypothetical protein